MQEPMVILWWGADVCVLQGDQKASRRALREKEDPIAAILRMIGDESPGARAVRILYHPDTLAAHEIGCPDTSRPRLRKLFAGEYRALDDPGTAWSAEPIRRGLNGCGTVLYIDEHSRLPRLVEGLARRGLRVEGAWPLQSAVEAAPPCDAGGRGFLSLVATDGQALVSSLGASGDRSVRFYDGREFADAAIAGMRTAFARFEEGERPQGLMMIEDGPHAAALREAARALSLAEISMAGLLAHARLLSPGGFSNFLPQKSFLAIRPAPRQAVAALAAILLAGAGWRAWAVRENQQRLQRQLASLREQRLLLEQSNEVSRAARLKIDQLRHALRRLQCAPQRHYEFLTALARTVPDSIALQAVTIQDGGFSMTGHIYEGAGRPENPLAPFLREFAFPGAAWRLSEAPAKTSDPDFAIEGSFQEVESQEPQPSPFSSSSASPDGASTEAVAGLETRLAAAQAGLSSIEEFDARMRRWGQNWIIAIRSADPFPGMEVRRYGLSHAHPGMESWREILETVKTICDEPGLTVDRVALAAAPDGTGHFSKAEIGLTIRLRP